VDGSGKVRIAGREAIQCNAKRSAEYPEVLAILPEFFHRQKEAGAFMKPAILDYVVFEIQMPPQILDRASQIESCSAKIAAEESVNDMESI